MAATQDTLISSNVDQMLAAALERGDSLETGRYIATFKEGSASADAREAMTAQGMRVADARDFENEAASLDQVGDADALYFPEIGAAVVSGPAAQERGMEVAGVQAEDSAIEIIEPEYFAFDSHRNDYLRGFARAAEAISRDLLDEPAPDGETEEEEVAAAAATWGLVRCRVPFSSRTGLGIKVAVLDTGFDRGHADFSGRAVFERTFVGQPVLDLHSHGTHCIGTACGPVVPAGTAERYGIAARSTIFVGKVLSNSGTGSTAGILAGLNWAIANRCQVISMSLGSQSPVQAAYTAAGNAALAAGCLIIAAAGNSASQTGSPANSPTIMSVASLDPDLRPSGFSNFGKIELAAPGRDVRSSVPRPARYGIKSGTSMATPHVAGCAALWAESSPLLRGRRLWQKLLASARPLPHPAARVGKGLVQAPI